MSNSKNMRIMARDRTLKLLTRDNEVICANYDSIKDFTYIREIISRRGKYWGCGIDSAVPLPEMRRSILDKILRWADECRMDSGIQRVDADFFDVEKNTLFELLKSSYDLGIDVLVDGACKAVAELIKGKKPEEIRVIFNVTNDFTPEQEARIRKENEWTLDN